MCCKISIKSLILGHRSDTLLPTHPEMSPQFEWQAEDLGHIWQLLQFRSKWSIRMHKGNVTDTFEKAFIG